MFEQVEEAVREALRSCWYGEERFELRCDDFDVLAYWVGPYLRVEIEKRTEYGFRIGERVEVRLEGELVPAEVAAFSSTGVVVHLRLPNGVNAYEVVPVSAVRKLET